MRLFLAYFISALFHAALFAGFVYWLPTDNVLNLDMARGEPIVVVFSLPSSEAQPPPASEAKIRIEAPVEVSPDERPASNEPTPTELVKEITDAPRVEIGVLMEPPTAANTLAVVESRPTTRTKHDLAEPTEPPADAKPIPRPEKPTPRLEIESSVSMPFQMPTQVGADVDQLPRNIATNRPPLYPAEALAAGVEGKVMLRLVIAADGVVESARIESSSGSPSLDRAALAAANLWKFHPARRKGRQVAHEVLYPVRFSIRG